MTQLPGALLRGRTEKWAGRGRADARDRGTGGDESVVTESEARLRKKSQDGERHRQEKG